MSKIEVIQDIFFTTVVFIFTTVVLSEKFSDRATTVVFYYSGFKILKITLLYSVIRRISIRQIPGFSIFLKKNISGFCLILDGCNFSSFWS